MLEVLPIQTKQEQEAACAACNAEYREELLCYAAYVEGELMGICQFSLKPEGGIISSLDAKDGADFQTLFVLGRAAMSFIEICGGETAFFDAPVNEDNKLLVGAIGFKPNESGRYSVDLRGFFDHPCSHN